VPELWTLGSIRVMRKSARPWIYSLAVIACLVISYFLTFVWFVRTHERIGVRGELGQRLTTVWIAMPDTKINRALVVFYSPCFRYLYKPLEQVEWERP
jgi:hypothetical protein